MQGSLLAAAGCFVLCAELLLSPALTARHRAMPCSSAAPLARQRAQKSLRDPNEGCSADAKASSEGSFLQEFFSLEEKTTGKRQGDDLLAPEGEGTNRAGKQYAPVTMGTGLLPELGAAASLVRAASSSWAQPEAHR